MHISEFNNEELFMSHHFRFYVHEVSLLCYIVYLLFVVSYLFYDFIA